MITLFSGTLGDNEFIWSLIWNGWCLTSNCSCPQEDDLDLFHEYENPIGGKVTLSTPFNKEVWDRSFEIEIKDGKVPGEVHLDDALFNKTITKKEHDQVTAFISKDVVDPSCLDKQIQKLQPILDKAGVSIKVQTITSLV